jgi:hypothetical protein
MKIATKTLATLMLIVMLTISSTSLALAAPVEEKSDGRSDKKLERIYRRHDRKMELRASVLGTSADQLREELKNRSFDGVIKQYGFRDRQSFHTALIGKLKDELRHRGWSDQKIEKLVQKKLEKFQKKTEDVRVS